MIFKIRLPILENLLGIINDDPERNDVGKRTKEPMDPNYYNCLCICHDASYGESNFHGMFF